MTDEVNKLLEAKKVLEDNKEDFHKWKAAADSAAAAGEPAPLPPPSIAGAVNTIGGTLGNVALGVGATAADAVGVVGGTANALHDNINTFFSNLRQRLGV